MWPRVGLLDIIATSSRSTDKKLIFFKEIRIDLDARSPYPCHCRIEVGVDQSSECESSKKKRCRQRRACGQFK
jgi:hypothetical protein